MRARAGASASPVERGTGSRRAQSTPAPTSPIWQPDAACEIHRRRQNAHTHRPRRRRGALLPEDAGPRRPVVNSCACCEGRSRRCSTTAAAKAGATCTWSTSCDNIHSPAAARPRRSATARRGRSCARTTARSSARCPRARAAARAAAPPPPPPPQPSPKALVSECAGRHAVLRGDARPAAEVRLFAGGRLAAHEVRRPRVRRRPMVPPAAFDPLLDDWRPAACGKARRADGAAGSPSSRASTPTSAPPSSTRTATASRSSAPSVCRRSRRPPRSRRRCPRPRRGYSARCRRRRCRRRRTRRAAPRRAGGAPIPPCPLNSHVCPAQTPSAPLYPPPHSRFYVLIAAAAAFATIHSSRADRSYII